MSSVGASSSKGYRGKSEPSKYVSRSARAGLQFPVGRVARFLKEGKYADRVNAGAPVYLTAVLEYLACEVLELSGNEAKSSKNRRISPTHIQHALLRDDELCKMLGNVTIPSAGVVPKIHKNILPKTGGEGEK